MKSTDSVIVSWDFSHGKDVGVLIVPNDIEIIRVEDLSGEQRK